MQHKEVVEKYDGSLEELANDIGNLRYDSLADFISLLSAKLNRDSEKDLNAGRKKLAHELHVASYRLSEVEESIINAWEISAPYTNINKPL